MSNLKRDGKLRWAPSYLRNRGKVTRAQKRALREWWRLYGITFEHGIRIDLDRHFDGDGPLLIEIGFGMGEHLIHLAESLPDHRILGIEVHRPGLAATTRKIHDRNLSNVRLIRGDARLILTDHLEAAIARAVILQFPDPWPKPGDEHRRLVQPGMIEEIYQKLIPGGEFLLATDIESYAKHCQHVFSQFDQWREVEHSNYQDHRVLTLYEEKGFKAGRATTELVFCRQA